MRHWKKIEGLGGTKQILKIWRHDFHKKIEFSNLLRQIDEEFPYDLSRRTKIIYLNELVDQKLLGKQKIGRLTFYWPLEEHGGEVVRACLLDFITQTSEDSIIPAGFLTFFGINWDNLTINEKNELQQIKTQFHDLFSELMTFNDKIRKTKVQVEWSKIIRNKEIHPISKLIFSHLYKTTWMSQIDPADLAKLTGNEIVSTPKDMPEDQKERALWLFSIAISMSLRDICEENGIRLTVEKDNLFYQKAVEAWKKDSQKFNEFDDMLAQILQVQTFGGVGLVCVTPRRDTPLGRGVFQFKYALEKDLTENALHQIEVDKRRFSDADLKEKVTSLIEEEKKREPLNRPLLFVFALDEDKRQKEQLRHEVFDWLKSEIV